MRMNVAMVTPMITTMLCSTRRVTYLAISNSSRHR
jgi:hypothetical protein